MTNGDVVKRLTREIETLRTDKVILSQENRSLRAIKVLEKIQRNFWFFVGFTVGVTVGATITILLRPV